MAWALLLFSGLLWPHMARWRSQRSANPERTERTNLLVDSAIAALWVPLMHFNLLPSALILTLATVDKINTGIRGLWQRSLPGMAGAIVLGGLLTGFAFAPVTSRSEEHTSELQSLMRISYAVFCLKKKNNK